VTVGWYDTFVVEVPVECPGCARTVHRKFQSKAPGLKCVMARFREGRRAAYRSRAVPDGSYDAYDWCKVCGKMVHVSAVVRGGVFVGVTGARLEDGS